MSISGRIWLVDVQKLLIETCGVSLCLHGMHMNLRMFAMGEDFEALDELSRFMSKVENNILRPSRGLIRRPHSMNVVSLVTDSNSESDSEDANMVFTNFTSVARYEPPLHLCSGPHPIFKVEGATFVVPPKEHWRRETICLPVVLSHSCVGLPFFMRSLSSALLHRHTVERIYPTWVAKLSVCQVVIL